MPPFLQFIIRRILTIPVTLLVITMLLYGGVMLTPPEARATLYWPKSQRNLSEEQIKKLTENIIERYHLRAPFPIQYGIWVKSMFEEGWGYSPILKSDVLPALLRRTPATVELTLFSLLFFVPLGLFSGVLAGWRQNKTFDTTFRSMAFLGTSVPPFILSLILLAVFYVNLGWFGPERISIQLGYQITQDGYRTPTGMMTVDALLNGRYDIFVDALRHLVLPAVTLSLYHWASLGRLTRSTIIEHRRKAYIIAARARGLSERQVMWHHAFRNVLAPAFTSMGLSAASLLTGIFVVELLYNLNGISEVIAKAMGGIPDATASLGFSVYSVIIVLVLMFILDVIQAAFDPRIREEMLKS